MALTSFSSSIMRKESFAGFEGAGAWAMKEAPVGENGRDKNCEKQKEKSELRSRIIGKQKCVLPSKPNPLSSVAAGLASWDPRGEGD